ncbi:MAG: gamma-glutamylcyclotransferase, partial [Alphaproteobacteria bacterium]|nr:gamma-glutamylcyclotransferase [Alphaproteobacteria bacterium]
MAKNLTREPDGLASGFIASSDAGRIATQPIAGLATVDHAVAALRPDVPVVCLRPQVLRDAATTFVGTFPGRVFYAVKCNPDPQVILALAEGGVRCFDVASLTEVALVRRLVPDATLAFMHPVKTRPSIRAAYYDYGVRDFSLDSFEELIKILDETDRAGDLGLHVRLALPKGSAVCDLSGKFGVPAAQAAMLLKAARAVGRRVGLCFHTGSQGLEPEAFRRALEQCGEAIRQSGVAPDVIDVGGGFPVSYPDQVPPSLDLYFQAIREGFGALGLPAATELWCEPGRALVGAGSSVVVQVLKRRGNELFISDGMYGTLSDAGLFGFRFPVRVVRTAESGRGRPSDELVPFLLWGPTCDSTDKMPGPFMISADVREGDYLEIGQTGGYGTSVRTRFNGFDRVEQVAVSDAPLLLTPGLDDRPERPLFVYGTLLDRDMLAAALGRPALGVEAEPARADGFARRRVRGEERPTLSAADGAATEGLLLQGLGRADLARLRFHAGSTYALRRVAVTCADGTVVSADAFVADESAGKQAGKQVARATAVPWTVDAWRRGHRAQALRATRELMRMFGKLTPC